VDTGLPEDAEEAVLMTFVDPSRNPLHDPDSGLYHGDVPVDPTTGPILRHAPAGDPDATYDDWTLEQLKGEARARGLSGYSTLNKADLIAALAANDAEVEQQAAAADQDAAGGDAGADG
jgi:hypothetical protein